MARIRRTTSEPALTNSSLPTLNAPATGASCSTSLSASSSLETSNATINGLCITPGLRHGWLAEGTVFDQGSALFVDLAYANHVYSTIAGTDTLYDTTIAGTDTLYGKCFGQRNDVAMVLL